ncbi:MAG TPA: hypothetical protein VF538_04170 [Pyrinomonadaceae bacterium]|jgi:GT2 family glycosyltransferase
MRTPVAFIIFNRPDVTARVFAEIARARPPKLLVVADGPRADRPGEREACRAARAVVERVDWDCEVLTNFSDVNLGCRGRVSSGITWVFEQVEEAIILEDDCVPDPTFFRYCDELLEKYRDDERVPMICGSSFLPEKPATHSYYFSRYGHVWGWATWRRAWGHYDVSLAAWPELRGTTWLEDVLGEPAAAAYWRERFDATYAGQVDTWDYQWFFTCWAQNGMAVLPSINLVTNVGFGEDATHTKTAVSTMSYLPAGAIPFPLRHPRYMVRSREDDQLAFRRICPWAVPQPGLGGWARRNLSPLLPGPIRKSLSYLRAKSA